MWEYTRARAEADRLLAEAKSELKVTEADLASSIRLDPVRYGIVKVTEDAIKGAVCMQPEWTIANAAVIDAQYTADLHSGAVVALDHRKKALESLVWLQGRDYYAEPIAPLDPDVAEAVREQDKQNIRRNYGVRRDLDVPPLATPTPEA
jgi:hypothetical protein